MRLERRATELDAEKEFMEMGVEKHSSGNTISQVETCSKVAHSGLTPLSASSCNLQV